MILSVIAVGDPYINEVIPHLNRFNDYGYKIKILTDQSDRFNGYDVETYHHDKKIFSYFDKLIFPLKLSEKYKSNVLYVDADMIRSVSDQFIRNFDGGNEFLYHDTWPDGGKFKDYKNTHYFKILLDYFNLKNIDDIDDLITILEWTYYFPYSEINTNLLIDIEKIKPVFEYMSLMVDSGYSGIGNGEGLALSYVLNKNKIPVKKFKNQVFSI